jgi:hypothetical protein
MLDRQVFQVWVVTRSSYMSTICLQDLRRLCNLFLFCQSSHPYHASTISAMSWFQSTPSEEVDASSIVNRLNLDTAIKTIYQ